MIRRKLDSARVAKVSHVKDLLSKAGLGEKHVSQAIDAQQHWMAFLRECLGPELGGSLTRCVFEHHELTVWVRTAALAARVQLTLASALLDGRLVRAGSGEAPRKLAVRVSR